MSKVHWLIFLCDSVNGQRFHLTGDIYDYIQIKGHRCSALVVTGSRFHLVLRNDFF